jgi:hypothetical protein
MIPETKPHIFPGSVSEDVRPSVQDVRQGRVFNSVAERPDFRQRIEQIDALAYPAFMRHTDLDPLWPAVYEVFPEYQLVMYDGDSGTHLGHGNVVPFAWNEAHDELPKSAVEMVRLALDQKRRGVRSTVLGALQAVITPTLQGNGLSPYMLKGMANLAASRGYLDLFAPIRLQQKELYPLARFESYVGWTRPDGLPNDSWQRVHVRLGATPAGIIDSWLTVIATVQDWGRWTGMIFPASGKYTVPGALVPIEIDVERNIGRYVEPHLWMRYKIL